MQGGAFWRNVLGALLALAWVLSSHLASAGFGPVDLRVAVAVVPALAALALVARQSRSGAALAGVGIAAAVAVWRWPWLRGHFTWLFLLQHLGVHLALAAWFGLSLAAGREPVVSAMARMIHSQPLAPRTLRYTRGVTWLWTLFFLGNAAVSLLLFAWASVEVWSVHANLLTGPLVGAVFLGEMLVRRQVLPREERPSLHDIVRSYRQRRAAASPARAPQP